MALKHAHKVSKNNNLLDFLTLQWTAMAVNTPERTVVP